MSDTVLWYTTRGLGLVLLITALLAELTSNLRTVLFAVAVPALLAGAVIYLSPWHRVSVYLSLCAVSNHIRRFKRPEYIAHRDFTPIQCLPDDCLLQDYDVPLPWQNGTPEAALHSALVS